MTRLPTFRVAALARLLSQAPWAPWAPAACAVLCGLVSMPTAAAPGCQNTSGPQPLAVVELYTSEGCSSCPPAERWLSTLTTRDGVLALAFHVSYWDHLGWLDRFATAQTTARQYQVKAALGARYVYTPQVLLNGQDHRAWRGQPARSLPGPSASVAPALRLSRDGETVTAQVSATTAHPALAGYWAVLSDGVSSKVTRGENAGETLRHDHVVSHYQPVAPWPASRGATLRMPWPTMPGARVAFVVTDQTGIRPVQGLDLACP